ncbi:hypothetical protein O3935_05240 [Leptotrichia wadei]
MKIKSKRQQVCPINKEFYYRNLLKNNLDNMQTKKKYKLLNRINANQR